MRSFKSSWYNLRIPVFVEESTYDDRAANASSLHDFGAAEVGIRDPHYRRGPIGALKKDHRNTRILDSVSKGQDQSL